MRNNPILRAGLAGLVAGLLALGLAYAGALTGVTRVSIPAVPQEPSNRSGPPAMILNDPDWVPTNNPDAVYISISGIGRDPGTATTREIPADPTITYVPKTDFKRYTTYKCVKQDEFDDCGDPGVPTFSIVVSDSLTDLDFYRSEPYAKELTVAGRPAVLLPSGGGAFDLSLESQGGYSVSISGMQTDGLTLRGLLKHLVSVGNETFQAHRDAAFQCPNQVGICWE